MVDTQRIETVLAERCAMMDTAHGEHDARTALRARATHRSDRALLVECLALHNAPRAYAVAYLETVLRYVSEEE